MIAPHISIIFNSSLANGIFPDDWKSARVTPLFKHGERSDVDNYRPISVISIIGKVFERIIYNHLFAYLSDHNILSKHQFGFHALHSTVTALLDATDSWAYNIDMGNVNAVVFLDLKKAFDTVDHHILLSKLHLYGLTGVSHKLFSFYLDNRTQKCVVNGSHSECCTLKCGIPRRTILGPLLFLLYINDLPNCLSHFVPRMYADDTHLTYSNGNIHSVQSSLSEDLLNINRWLTANKLTLNMTKTEFMLNGSRQKLNNLSSLPSLNINNVPIKHSHCSKSLGILIGHNLTWETHVDALSKKITSGIGAIKCINHCLPPTALHDVYYGLVQSHFDYCSVVWGNCGKSLRDKLQRLQNRAARVLTNSNYDADASILLNDSGWQNLETQRQIQKAVMVYKSLNCLAPDYMSSKFILRSDLFNSYNLRDSVNKLAVPLLRTDYYRNTVSIRISAQPRISFHLEQAPILKAEKVNKRSVSNKRPPPHHPLSPHTPQKLNQY